MKQKGARTSASARPWVHRWKTLTREGNQALADGDLARARACYSGGLAAAQAHFARLLDGEALRDGAEAIMAYYIASANLAELHAQKGQLGRGEAVLERVFTSATRAMSNPTLSTATLEAVLRNIKYPVADYLALGEPDAACVERRRRKLAQLLQLAGELPGHTTNPEEATQC
ncbi:MAG: hypothetical protein AAGH19_06435 [Pseudomonadota bacterium]